MARTWFDSRRIGVRGNRQGTGITDDPALPLPASTALSAAALDAMEASIRFKSAISINLSTQILALIRNRRSCDGPKNILIHDWAISTLNARTLYFARFVCLHLDEILPNLWIGLYEPAITQ